jgi:hypothetical protein
MPADIDTFHMLRPAVLEGMTVEQLKREIERVSVMYERVHEYERAIVDVLKTGLVRPPE